MTMLASAPAVGARLVEVEQLARGELADGVRGEALVLAPGAGLALTLPERRGASDTVRVRVKAQRCGDGGLVLSTGAAGRVTAEAGWSWVSGRAPGGILRVRSAERDPAARCRLLVDSVDLIESVPLYTAAWTRHLDADPRFGAALDEHFAGFTPENELKMALIHPERDRYDFRGADRLVDLAEQRGMTVHGHVLVWGEHLPGWMDERDALGRTTWSQPALRAALKDHVQTLVRRYRGRIRQWDVVNEVLEFDGTFKRNRLLELLGPSYIVDAFRWAHEADPEARLFINEKDADVINPRSTALLELVKELRARGLRVDGVGLQQHLSLKIPPTKYGLYENMRRFSDAGLAVRVSELDVTREHLPNDEEGRGRIYDAAAGACLMTPRCESVTVWGISDRFSWQGAGSGALPFDAEFRPKPWWAPFAARLAGRPPATGAR